VRRLVGEVPYFLRLKSHANLLFRNLVYCTVVIIWGFYIITEIFYIIITITTAIQKKVVRYHLWGVFSIYGFTIRSTEYAPFHLSQIDPYRSFIFFRKYIRSSKPRIDDLSSWYLI
jgi:hypothetical protein